MDAQANPEGLSRAGAPPIASEERKGEKLGAAPDLHPYGVAPAADHPAEIVLRFCADWAYAVRLVHDELLVSPDGAPSAEAKMAAELLPAIFYPAAVMDEDLRRVRRWLCEIHRAKTSIERWIAAAINPGEVGSGDRAVVDTSGVENGGLTFATDPVVGGMVPA